jgi:hypothetical protein
VNNIGSVNNAAKRIFYDNNRHGYYIGKENFWRAADRKGV